MANSNEFLQNQIYLISFNPASSNAGFSRRAIEPQLYSLDIRQSNVEEVKALIRKANIDMINSKDNLQEATAIEAFKRLEMQVIGLKPTKALQPTIKVERKTSFGAKVFDMDAELQKAKLEYELELKELDNIKVKDNSKQSPDRLDDIDTSSFMEAESDYVKWKNTKKDYSVDVGNKWRVDGALDSNPTYDLIQEIGQQNLVHAVEVGNNKHDYEDDVLDNKHVFSSVFDLPNRRVSSAY